MNDDRRRVRRAVAALAIAGALTHFAGLAHPRQVVFDEATFGKYVAAYCCTGERIFDVHPPHGKLLIAAAARAGGFDGAFTFDHIGLPYGETPVVALRAVPAIAGLLIPPLLVLLLLELGASFPAAVLGGVLLLLDNAMLLETRIIVWDGLLVASTLGALVCFFSAARHGGFGWRLIAAGALAGLAVGCKTTGLAAPALMGICLLLGAGGARGALNQRLRQGAVIALAGITVYLGGWWLHWALLTEPGIADGFYTTTGRFMDDLLTMHGAMIRENVRLAATHPDSSAPWTWPAMKVAPYFWQGDGASIYLVGNPVVWWGSSLAIAAIVAFVIARGPLGRRLPAVVNPRAKPWIALTAYVIAYAPLLPVGRVLFLYHYLTPLVCAVAFVLLWLDRFGWTRPGRLADQRVSYFVVVGLAVAGFLVVSPLTYGFSAGGYDEWLAAFVRSWR
jgi:dolichyl-phosphate-mannose--protein O-mannosyl transferase